MLDILAEAVISQRNEIRIIFSLLFRARPLQISGGLHRMCCCRYLLLICIYITIATKSSQLSFSMKQYVSPVHQFSVATATATGSKKLYKRRARISYSWLVYRRHRCQFIYRLPISHYYSCVRRNAWAAAIDRRVLELRNLSGSFNLLKIAIYFFGDSASEFAQFPTSANDPSRPRSAYFCINGHSCKQRQSTEFFRR